MVRGRELHLAAAMLLLAVATGRADEPSLHDLRTRILSTDQVLLEYRVQEGSGTVRLVAQDREVSREVRAGRAALAEAIASLRARLAAGETAPEEAATLYGWLVAPVEPDLPPDARLVVVPDGTLDGLPFAALRSPDARFLAEEHAVSFAASASAIATEPGKRAPRPRPAPALTAAAVDSFLTANGVAWRRLFTGDAAADSALQARFARALASGMPPDVALVRAQRAAIAAGQPPLAWAGYSVVGRMAAPRAGGEFPLWLVPAGMAVGVLLILLGLRLSPGRGAADGNP